MPIKWSALKVSLAADMVEGYLNEAVPHLESVLEIARKALKIPDVPQYIQQDFTRVIDKVEDALGNPRWKTDGWIKHTVKSIRDDIPADALKADQDNQKHGATQSLI